MFPGTKHKSQREVTGLIPKRKTLNLKFSCGVVTTALLALAKGKQAFVERNLSKIYENTTEKRLYTAVFRFK